MSAPAVEPPLVPTDPRVHAALDLAQMSMAALSDLASELLGAIPGGPARERANKRAQDLIAEIGGRYAKVVASHQP
jgi:hypothetical protein